MTHHKRATGTAEYLGDATTEAIPEHRDAITKHLGATIAHLGVFLRSVRLGKGDGDCGREGCKCPCLARHDFNTCCGADIHAPAVAAQVYRNGVKYRYFNALTSKRCQMSVFNVEVEPTHITVGNFIDEPLLGLSHQFDRLVAL